MSCLPRGHALGKVDKKGGEVFMRWGGRRLGGPHPAASSPETKVTDFTDLTIRHPLHSSEDHEPIMGGQLALPTRGCRRHH